MGAIEAIYKKNCLMDSFEAVLRNKTTLLFMRNSEDVDTPFITIEIAQGVLVKAYHYCEDDFSDCTCEEINWILCFCKRNGIDTEHVENYLRFCEEWIGNL